MSSRLSEFLAGCRDEAPLLLGVAPFGMLYGIGALAAGMPPWLAQAASAVVFAGAAQLVIVQMLAAGAGALPTGLTAGLLNLRHVLYGVSMAEHVRHLPRRWRMALAYLLTDEAYAVAILRYQAKPRPGAGPDLRHWYFLGCGFTLWAAWQLSTAAGLLFGATVPAEWEMDFAVPLTFIALLAQPMREGAGRVAALVAAVAALALAALPFRLGLVLAILLGLLAGALAAKRGRE